MTVCDVLVTIVDQLCCLIVVSDPAVAAKIQELSCLINLEEKIVEAVESTVDLPNIDKKSRKKQQKTLARSNSYEILLSCGCVCACTHVGSMIN